MPWRLRKEVYLILLGCLAIALSIVVFVLNQGASSDLLAVVGFFGGIAIILNSLPSNGNNTNHHN
jgi:hypothetical protein